VVPKKSGSTDVAGVAATIGCHKHRPHFVLR
jgi:hypothetical protein